MIYDIPVKDFLSPMICLKDSRNNTTYTELSSRQFSTALNLYFLANHISTSPGSYKFWIEDNELETINAVYKDWYLVWYNSKFHYRIEADSETIMLLKLSL